MNFFKRWRESKTDQPNDPMSRKYTALKNKQDVETLRLLTAVIEADPQNGDAHLGLGMVHLRRFAAEPAVSTLHDAVNHLTQAIELLPQSSEAHFYLAYAESFTLDTVAQAEQHLQRALELDSELADRALEIQERIAAARAGMQQQGLDPETIHAAVQRYEYGQTLIANERYSDAVVAFQDAITLYPAYAEALLALGEAYRRMSRDADALATFRRALAVRPNMVEAHVSLGSLYVQQGDRARALEHLSLALEQSPDQPQLLRNVGLLQLATGKPTDAAATFRRLCALTPDDPEPRLHLALAALQSGDTATARDSLSRIEGTHLNAKQHALAAQMYEQLGDADAAERHRARTGAT